MKPIRILAVIASPRNEESCPECELVNPFARAAAGYISGKMRRAMRKGNVEPHR